MDDISDATQRNPTFLVGAYGVDARAIGALVRDTGADKNDVIAELWLQLQLPACARAGNRAGWAVAAARVVLLREHAPTAAVSFDDEDSGLRETLAAPAQDEPTPLARGELTRLLAQRLGVGVRRAQQRVKSRASASDAAQGDLFDGVVT